MDTTIFGRCILHIKLFRDNPANSDIMQEFVASNLNRLKTIHNSSQDMSYSTIAKVIPALMSYRTVLSSCSCRGFKATILRATRLGTIKPNGFGHKSFVYIICFQIGEERMPE
jgi:hypothetical protein